jgi:anti-sigma regulatory factor (Ser/Thr protein kinase)
MGGVETHEVVLAAEDLAPAIARRTIADYVRGQGYDAATAHRVELAVSEAVSNVVMHAYKGRDEHGDARITVRAIGGEVEVVVADTGIGMGPRPDSPGLGVGLPLIEGLTEHYDARPAPGGGTELHMRFRAHRA